MHVVSLVPGHQWRDAHRAMAGGAGGRTPSVPHPVNKVKARVRRNDGLLRIRRHIAVVDRSTVGPLQRVVVRIEAKVKPGSA